MSIFYKLTQHSIEFDYFQFNILEIIALILT
jgi:hypothetical protein